ncbi:MAG: type II toxin-antitoxin system CcdA family antitoxin [Candidatus Thermoplasmatota archaeon]
MPTVSVRIDDDSLIEAKQFGINVSEAFRRGLAVELRKARVAANVAKLAGIARKPATPAVEQLRRLRDDRSS